MLKKKPIVSRAKKATAVRKYKEGGKKKAYKDMTPAERNANTYNDVMSSVNKYSTAGKVPSKGGAKSKAGIGSKSNKANASGKSGSSEQSWLDKSVTPRQVIKKAGDVALAPAKATNKIVGGVAKGVHNLAKSQANTIKDGIKAGVGVVNYVGDNKKREAKLREAEQKNRDYRKKIDAEKKRNAELSKSKSSQESKTSQDKSGQKSTTPNKSKGTVKQKKVIGKTAEQKFNESRVTLDAGKRDNTPNVARKAMPTVTDTPVRTKPSVRELKSQIKDTRKANRKDNRTDRKKAKLQGRLDKLTKK